MKVPLRVSEYQHQTELATFHHSRQKVHVANFFKFPIQKWQLIIVIGLSEVSPIRSLIIMYIALYMYEITIIIMK